MAFALAVLLACAITLGLSGCGSNENGTAGAQTTGNTSASNASGPANTNPEFRNTNLGCGWQPVGSLELEYAEGFTVDYFADGFKLICISDSSRYLVIPEGASAPANLATDIALIQQPQTNTYLVATDTMCLIDALGQNGNIALSSVKADDCSVEGFRAALEAGDILYGGKYNAPDYELILQTGCTLAIESTMINHTPEVREQLQAMGLTVLTEQSSYEATALGRMEWIKLYGAIYNVEERARNIFDTQVAQIDDAIASSPADDERKTVAFFYINSNGAAVARQSGDYIAQMIDLAGGKYIFSSLGDDGAKSTITLEMEQFYATAKDADVIIYNTSIDQSVTCIDDLITKNTLLGDFKAVQSGNVWATDQNMYQQMIRTGDIVADFHAVFTSENPTDLKFLTRLEQSA